MGREQRGAGRVHQGQRLAAVGEIVGIDTVHAHPGILVLEGGGIADEDNELAGTGEGADGECVVDAIRETHAAQFEIRASHVFQFDELERVAIVVRRSGRVIHDFGDEEAAEVLDDVERGLGQRAPDAAAQNARLDVRALCEEERTAVSQRGWRNGAARQTRVGTVPRVIDRSRRRAEGQLET